MKLYLPPTCAEASCRSRHGQVKITWTLLSQFTISWNLFCRGDLELGKCKRTPLNWTTLLWFSSNVCPIHSILKLYKQSHQWNWVVNLHAYHPTFWDQSISCRKGRGSLFQMQELHYFCLWTEIKKNEKIGILEIYLSSEHVSLNLTLVRAG